MNKEQIQQVLTDHLLWLQGKGGSRANLSGADLSGADLSKANLSGADLSKANLSGADLSGADLSKANLADAKLSDAYMVAADLTWSRLLGANLTRTDLLGANLSKANLERANLSGANLSGANLSSADLYGANLTSADLSKANLTAIKEDVWRVLSSAPDEVQAVRTALMEGRVDGYVYDGECACLVGTIANARGVPYESLNHDEESPAEMWFLTIQKGDIPETSQFSKIALEWIDEWIANANVTGMS